jgi:hypothetical protein
MTKFAFPILLDDIVVIIIVCEHSFPNVCIFYFIAKKKNGKFVVFTVVRERWISTTHFDPGRHGVPDKMALQLLARKLTITLSYLLL